MLSTAFKSIQARSGVFYLCTTIFLTSVGMGALAPILPLFTESEFHVNRTQVGIAVGLFGISRIFTSLPAGYLTQRYGRRVVLQAGSVVSVFGAVMVAFSFSYSWLVCWRFISGLGWSIYLTGASIYLRDVASVDNRGRFLSLLEMSILAGQSLGPLLGGYLGDRWGYRIPLHISAVFVAISFLVLQFLVPESRPKTSSIPENANNKMESDSSERSVEIMGRNKLLRLLLSPAFVFVGMFTLMIVANRQGGRFSVLPLYGEKKGFSASQLGSFISVTHIPQFFTTMLAGFLSDKFGRKATIIPAVSLITVGLILFIFTDSVPKLIMSGILLGLGEGLAGPPSLAFFADIAPPGLEGVTMGLYRTFGGVGSAIGAVLLGGIADLAGFAASLIVDAILLICAGIGVMVFVKETLKKKEL
ncbi:MAG: hypothetical protein CL886_05635 [Dehalococcoidia bacterium]|nr:hypothetical protein [Dehalococcoidia bacterium]